MDNYSVYCHINRINNKRYIGITSINPKKRWLSGNGYRGMVFGKAIIKYGWDSFTHEILHTNLSEEEALAEEKRLIQKYKTCNRKYGYNQSPGGNVVSATMREKMRKKMTGKNNPMYGKPRPENNLKATRKPVMCIETEVVYESISMASKLTGINLGHIASTCKGLRKSAGGFHWKYITVVKGGD